MLQTKGEVKQGTDVLAAEHRHWDASPPRAAGDALGENTGGTWHPQFLPLLFLSVHLQDVPGVVLSTVHTNRKKARTSPERRIWKIQTSEQSLCTQCGARREAELTGEQTRKEPLVPLIVWGSQDGREGRVSSHRRLPGVGDAQGGFGKTSSMS